MNRSQALYTSIGLQVKIITILVFAREGLCITRSAASHELGTGLLACVMFAATQALQDFAAIGIALSYRTPKQADKGHSRLTEQRTACFSVWSDS